MKGLIYSIFALIALLATACDTQHEPVEEQGSGRLVVTIGSAEIIGVEESRAELGDGNVADGGGMQDLTLILVDPHNIVVDKKSFSYDGTTWSGDFVESFDTNKQITTSFEGLDIAHYDIYAYANVQGRTDVYSSIATLVESVAVGSEFTLADATLPELTGTATPEKSDTNPMLLTAFKRIPISIGATSTTVELQRVMAYVELVVVNNTNKKITINSLQFDNINPATAYLTPHDDILASGGDNSYRSLPSFTGSVEVDKMSEKSVYGTCLLESSGDKSLYDFDINLSIEATTSAPVLQFNGMSVYSEAFVQEAIYALRCTNNSTDYYLADDGTGYLELLTTVDNSNYMRAEWYLYADGYLHNVGTGYDFYNNLNALSSLAKSPLTFDHRGAGQYYIYTADMIYLRYYYNQVVFTSYASGLIPWQLCLVNTSIDTGLSEMFPPKQLTQQISVIDGEGIAKPMTEIRRNSHITVVLNVYYDETTGGFKFEVEPWKRVNVDWTFT